MQRKEQREGLRQIYQRTVDGNKTFIPAKEKLNLDDPNKVVRVCAYCRVSTDNDEQLSSFELQQEHYRQLIGAHPTWELKHIYADVGTPYGRNTKACATPDYDAKHRLIRF